MRTNTCTDIQNRKGLTIAACRREMVNKVTIELQSEDSFLGWLGKRNVLRTHTQSHTQSAPFPVSFPGPLRAGSSCLVDTYYHGRRLRLYCPVLRAGVHERTARCRGGQVGQAAYRLHQLGQGQVGLHLHNLRRILKNTKMLVLVQCALSRRRQKGGGFKSKTQFFINKKRTWYYSTYQLRYKHFLLLFCAPMAHIPNAGTMSQMKFKSRWPVAQKVANKKHLARKIPVTCFNWISS